METKLTIGIPTFNGSKFISEAIESVLSNLYPEIEDRLEILISDNASTDTTSEIVSSYVTKYPQLISYYRNDINIGFDANIEEVFKKARGEYVEVLGDDDFLKNKSLRKIFTTIDSYPNISVVLVAVSFLNQNTHQEIEGLKFENDVLCADGNAFFQLSKWGTAAISSIIIKKSDWIEQNLEKYYGTQWIHIAAIMNILKKDKRAYIVSDNLVTVRVANARWETNFGNQLKAGMDHLRLFSGLLDLEYDYKTFEFYLNDRFNKNFRDVLTLRARRLKDNVPTALLMIQFFKKKPMFWLLHLSFLLMPYPLYQLIRALYKRLIGWRMQN